MMRFYGFGEWSLHDSAPVSVIAMEATLGKTAWWSEPKVRYLSPMAVVYGFWEHRSINTRKIENNILSFHLSSTRENRSSDYCPISRGIASCDEETSKNHVSHKAVLIPEIWPLSRKKLCRPQWDSWVQIFPETKIQRAIENTCTLSEDDHWLCFLRIRH